MVIGIMKEIFVEMYIQLINLKLLTTEKYSIDYFHHSHNSSNNNNNNDNNNNNNNNNNNSNLLI